MGSGVYSRVKATGIFEITDEKKHGGSQPLCCPSHTASLQHFTLESRWTLESLVVEESTHEAHRSLAESTQIFWLKQYIGNAWHCRSLYCCLYQSLEIRY